MKSAMKIKFYVFTGSVLSLLLFGSCVSTKHLTIDVLKPAKVAFDPNAKKLLLVNNSTVQPSNIGHTTHFFDDGEKYIDVATDSLSIFCLSALAEEIESKAFFNNTKLQVKSLSKTSDFKRIGTINKDSVNSILNANNADVILSLDKISVSDDLSEYMSNENYTFKSILEAAYETTWSISYSDKKQINHITFRDTIFWQNSSETKTQATAQLPKRSDALVDGALYVGRKLVNKFIPYWEKADRYFLYSDNKLIKQGIDSISNKNWHAAINLWEPKITKTSNSTLLAQLYNNLAICYEIQGDIEKALNYTTQAVFLIGKSEFIDYDIFTKVSDYQRQLAERQQEFKTLKQQLGN
jgi:Family of unknown function (DUF6340)